MALHSSSRVPVVTSTRSEDGRSVPWTEPTTLTIVSTTSTVTETESASSLAHRTCVISLGWHLCRMSLSRKDLSYIRKSGTRNLEKSLKRPNIVLSLDNVELSKHDSLALFKECPPQFQARKIDHIEIVQSCHLKISAICDCNFPETAQGQREKEATVDCDSRNQGCDRKSQSQQRLSILCCDLGLGLVMPSLRQS